MDFEFLIFDNSWAFNFVARLKLEIHEIKCPTNINETTVSDIMFKYPDHVEVIEDLLSYKITLDCLVKMSSLEPRQWKTKYIVFRI